MHRDFAFALRQWRTNLKFCLIIVLTLALGIGATTSIFSVVSGVLLRALPFPGSERLISLQTVVSPYGEAATKEAGIGTTDDVSFPDFFDWRSQCHTLEAIASAPIKWKLHVRVPGYMFMHSERWTLHSASRTARPWAALPKEA
jgi:hypothetical protein